MLFNSYVFVFAYLPIVLLGYSIAGHFHRKAVVIWLGIASLAFYGYWYPPFLLILGSSILVNYLFSTLISRTLPNSISTRLVLWVAISANLGLLCWFKYLFPFLNLLSDVLHRSHWGSVLLPLGISFFTFTQIAYLVDLQQGAASQQDFFSYLLFVTFFPHVIAGPILHHKSIMPQFQENRVYHLRFDDLAMGASWFVMGLFKKVVLADAFAPVADRIFAAHGAASFAASWVGLLSYSLQLYFDFSGYCDMACGLARMLSVDFPLNFSSPYKSRNIIEFWQRWHMTLTQYIGSYLYSPIQFRVTKKRRAEGKGVTRKAQATPEGFIQMIGSPTIITMLIAGIWHGAGLQFLIFGLMHGVFLTVAHAWRIFRPKSSDASAVQPRMLNQAGAVLLTYLSVLSAQVFFRAPSTREGFILSQRLLHIHVPHGSDHLGVHGDQAAFVVLGLIIVWAFPNTQQILARFKPALRLAPTDEGPRALPIYWAPTYAWALLLGAVFMFSLVRLQDPSTFLYFQF